MKAVFVAVLLLAPALAQDLWREDGRCGPDHPLADGSPGQCDPEGAAPRVGPCCSPKGFCGNTRNHCKCKTCIDYSKVKPATTKAPPPAPRASVKRAEEEVTEGPEVKVAQGQLKGRTVSGGEEVGSWHEFWSVPYAQPPTGSLRFKRPEVAEPWDNLRDATSQPPPCPQRLSAGPKTGEVIGVEDCLYLNVFTPEVKPAKPMAVMIWIHGGAFTEGAGHYYHPRPLMKSGVVVVSINYRLGGLGFLNFGNRHVMGNQGLWDQALAIEWVRENIGEFGGDPERVTIFGESAGGMSVHAQVLSHVNQGKLAGAIAQSGTMLAYQMERLPPRRVQATAREVSSKLGCGGQLTKATLSCLQDVPIERLMDVTSSPDPAADDQPAWGPIVDDFSSKPFMPIPPLEAMMEGKFNRVPFISGTVEHDGALFVPFAKPLLKYWSEAGPRMIAAIKDNRNPTTEEHRQIANILWNYYNHKSANKTLDRCLSDMLTDGYFFIPDQLTVKLMSKFNENVFNFILTEVSSDNFISKYWDIEFDPSLSPSHGEDIPYLFDYSDDKKQGLVVQMDQAERDLKQTMIQLWTSFAKNGRPSGEKVSWGSVAGGGGMLELKTDNQETQLGGREERKLLWDRMVWGPRQELIERKIIYEKANEFFQSSNLA